MRNPAIVSNAFVSAKLMPLEAERIFDGETHLVVNPLLPAPGTDDGLPIPPAEFWEGWGEVLAHYLDSGRDDVAAMLGVLEAAGVSPSGLRRVLDFGCASGRMLRFFPRRDGGEYWGVDIKARHIAWCQQHLSPPFSFATTTTFPHLPFEDDSFDLVYCGSVFTHMSELADAWVLELRRLLRTGAHAYITIHDEHSIAMLYDRYPDRGLTKTLQRLDAETSAVSNLESFFSIGIEPRSQVFYSSGYLVKKWSQFVEVVSVTPRAMDYQTAYLLRKR
ncbi:MAG: class I SAM-dependent methyltransferase [Actinobacteria bacterium]|nr:MAG: class I SAM-dependent methyltransferase [Actinomycetota bacterium]